MAFSAAALLLLGLSSPSQDRSTMSYFLRLSTVFHRVVAAPKAAPPFIVLLYFAVPPTPL
jgi:hypothetical protein